MSERVFNRTLPSPSPRPSPRASGRDALRLASEQSAATTGGVIKLLHGADRISLSPRERARAREKCDSDARIACKLLTTAVHVRAGFSHFSALIFLPILFACLAAHACSIPVFRYALDRWPADPFRLEVSAADAKVEAIAKFIRNFGSASALNLEIVRVPNGPSRLLRPHAEDTAAAPLWTGALNSAALASLTNSPGGDEIVRRLLEGDSAVWVLIESGDRAADDAAAKTLEKRLRYLQQVAALPPIDPTDPTSKLGPGPKLAVKFSVLRIPLTRPAGTPSPSDGERAGVRGSANSTTPAESTFLTTLAGPKSGLAATREPWVAAIFGRGRVLGAWPAKGFGDEQIEEVSLFLLGACSCQVKKLNPGWDLLLHADWDEQLRAIGYQPSDDPAVKPNAALAPETVSISGGESRPASSISRGKATLLGGGALLLLVLGGLAWKNSSDDQQ